MQLFPLSALICPHPSMIHLGTANDVFLGWGSKNDTFLARRVAGARLVHVSQFVFSRSSDARFCRKVYCALAIA